MTIYATLGVPEIINACGTVTRLSGGLMAPEVAEAMRQASLACVDMVQLQAAASRTIREATGAEAGIDAVPDELLDQITTVGSVAECAARIDAEHRSGVDMHNVTVQSRSEADLERALGDLVGA